MSSLEKGGEPLAVEGLTYLLTIESIAIEVLFAKPTTMLRMVPRPSKGGHGGRYCILMKYDAACDSLFFVAKNRKQDEFINIFLTY